MSKLVKSIEVKDNISFSVKDTDFLLKLIMRSSFEGSDLEVAYNVLSKLAKLHKEKLEG